MNDRMNSALFGVLVLALSLGCTAKEPTQEGITIFQADASSTSDMSVAADAAPAPIADAERCLDGEPRACVTGRTPQLAYI